MPADQPLLRTKLLKWLLVPLAVLLTTDTFISYWVALRFSERAYDHALVEIARETALHLRADAGGLRFEMADAARRVIFSDPRDVLFYEIRDGHGNPVDGTPIPSQSPAVTGERSEWLYDGQMNGTSVRIAELHVNVRGSPQAQNAVVRIAETKVKRNELAREIVLSVVLPQIALIALAGVLVWIGVVRGLSPLSKLQQAVAARSYRDRSPVVVAEVPGEVRPLMEEINQLLERLDGVLTMQNRFIADAAHQLKTPVAALQAQLELALEEPDPARTRESFAKISAGLNRVSRLVSQLLALARNEPEAARTMTLAPVDLAALAFEIAGEWVDEALRKNIDLGFEGVPSGVVVQGDSARLRELLDNLLDNAVRYTPSGGRVTLRVGASPAPSVTVNDDGPTIPAGDRKLIFDRFHRVLGTSQTGSGLGLAIAQEIAHLHGARITSSEDPDGKGNTFVLSFEEPPLH